MLAPCKAAAEAALSLLYPRHCDGCGLPLAPEEGDLCGDCRGGLRRLEPPFCSVCAQPFSGEMESPFRCENCGDRAFAFEHVASAYLSRGTVRRLIHGFKYDRQYRYRHHLAGWLRDALAEPRIAAAPPNALVPVPLHPVRFRERTFNQAAEIARIAGRHLGIPVLDCLLRIRPTSTQTRLDRAARIENLRGAFRLRHDRDVRDQSLVLIDDVFTTGSTADECAKVLRRAGAARVRVAVVARG